MTGLLAFLALMAIVVGGLWLFDRYIQARGGDTWRW